ncbi:phage tail protein [Enterovibrio norvegicus]|uniref:phage tail protein n=1 Tax=Enterovibrio norvegicus TaxID=188144 RepID=UPI000C818748|nr:phage tail protein [Enterovibrio norvegicus]PMN68407.1 hypothetical protein BCT27_23685 [Enterovibrio norvegicus]
MADAYTKTKLEHLTEYMVSHLKTGVLDNKIDAWQENAKLVISGEDRGNGGMVIAEWQYNAVISVEGFPHQLFDPRYLLASVACWLSEYDHDRASTELEDPSISVDVLDDGTADVSIEVELSEVIEMIPDPDGLITYQGQQYRVQTAPIYTAEEAEIINEANG